MDFILPESDGLRIEYFGRLQIGKKLRFRKNFRINIAKNGKLIIGDYCLSLRRGYNISLKRYTTDDDGKLVCNKGLWLEKRRYVK